MYKRLKKIKKLLPLYIMALPALVYLFINNYLPLTGMVVAFKDFDYSKGIYGSDWAGFRNFLFLFKNMMPRSKSSKIVRACTTRFLTLGPPKHENVAIYVVNQRNLNVYRIARAVLQRSNSQASIRVFQRFFFKYCSDFSASMAAFIIRAACVPIFRLV